MNSEQLELFQSGYAAGFNSCCGRGFCSDKLWLLNAIWRHDNQYTNENPLCPECQDNLDWWWIPEIFQRK